MKKHLLSLTSAAVVLALSACSDTKTVENQQQAAPAEMAKQAEATDQNISDGRIHWPLWWSTCV